MRFVPTFCMREGMILGKSLIGKNGEILLREKTALTEIYINRISELGYNGVYIEDDISKDIHIVEIINENLRHKTVKTIKNTFIALENGKNPTKNNDENLSLLVDNIVEEILNNKGMMVNMVDLKVFDDYTFFHSVNVTVLSVVLGVALRLDKQQLYKLGMGALLHDLGKVFVPKEIVLKPGKLEDGEFDTMKTHPNKGYAYIKERFDLPPTSYMGVLQHHEKFDGTGYPDRIAGEKISLFGRIISIADVYDALTSDRPYRNAMLPSEAMEYIMGNGGTMFDPNLVKIFARKVAPYPIGTCVRLSNNMIGLVVENYEDCCMRPKIKVVKNNETMVQPYTINLREELLTATIVEIVNI